MNRAALIARKPSKLVLSQVEFQHHLGDKMRSIVALPSLHSFESLGLIVCEKAATTFPHIVVINHCATLVFIFHLKRVKENRGDCLAFVR